MDHIWTCRCCGKQYDTLPMSYAPVAPDLWMSIPEAERGERGELTSDTCVIDGKYFFVLGCLEIPVTGCQDRFNWGVWVSVSQQSFNRIGELWDAELRDTEPPFFGWLCTNISNYPQTFELKTQVHLRNSGIRPFIELEPTDHPLAIEQRHGITIQRVEEIASARLQHH
jgi:hypothetical protein